MIIDVLATTTQRIWWRRPASSTAAASGVVAYEAVASFDAGAWQRQQSRFRILLMRCRGRDESSLTSALAIVLIMISLRRLCVHFIVAVVENRSNVSAVYSNAVTAIAVRSALLAALWSFISFHVLKLNTRLRDILALFEIDELTTALWYHSLLMTIAMILVLWWWSWNTLDIDVSYRNIVAAKGLTLGRSVSRQLRFDKMWRNHISMDQRFYIKMTFQRFLYGQLSDLEWNTSNPIVSFSFQHEPKRFIFHLN